METSARAGVPPGHGLIEEAVKQGSPAAAGIRKGDRVVDFGGRPLGRPRDLRRALGASPVSGPIPVTVARGDRRLKLTASFGP